MSQDPREVRTALAIERWREQARWRRLWTTLIFALGIALSATLIVFLILAATGAGDSAKLGTALTAVVEGAALAWIVRRRNEAVKEEQEAYGEVEQQLQTPEEKAALQAVAPAPSSIAAPGGSQLWQSFRRLPVGWQVAGWLFAWPVLAVLALWTTKLSTGAKVAIVIAVFFVLLLASFAQAPEPIRTPPQCYDPFSGQYYFC